MRVIIFIFFVTLLSCSKMLNYDNPSQDLLSGKRLNEVTWLTRDYERFDGVFTGSWSEYETNLLKNTINNPQDGRWVFFRSKDQKTTPRVIAISAKDIDGELVSLGSYHLSEWGQ